MYLCAWYYVQEEMKIPNQPDPVLYLLFLALLD